MIITVSKPLEQVLNNLAEYKKVFIVGCSACATKCQTGGEEQLKKMTEVLKQNGKEVTGTMVLDTPCDIRIVKKDLSKNESANKAEVILVLSCGGGVQAIEKVMDKPLIPGLNPVFLGSIERIGIYNEFCSMCGECILDKTAGICPNTRCIKGLRNGPCGGAVNGKCEVDLERDCAWVLIYEKLKKRGGKNILNEFVGSRNNFKPKRIDTTKKESK